MIDNLSIHLAHSCQVCEKLIFWSQDSITSDNNCFAGLGAWGAPKMRNADGIGIKHFYDGCVWVSIRAWLPLWWNNLWSNPTWWGGVDKYYQSTAVYAIAKHIFTSFSENEILLRYRNWCPNFRVTRKRWILLLKYINSISSAFTLRPMQLNPRYC